MARKIAFADLPGWAQKVIRDTGGQGICQMQKGSEALSVQGGVAHFNGVRVAAEGEVVDPTDTEEETVPLAKLPAWAQERIASGPGSSVQSCNGSDALSITSAGIVTFNGTKVAK